MYLITSAGKPVGFIGLKLTPPENPDFGPALIGDKHYLRQGIMQWAYKRGHASPPGSPLPWVN